MRKATTMRRMASAAVAGALTAGLLGFAAMADTAAAACRSLDPLAAESLFTIWQQAIASRDVGRLGELYAPDAVVLGPATGEAATTTPAHRRELAGLIALGPMKAVRRTVATGCESIRDYGTMVEVGAGNGRRAELRYSRVYELRGGRWLITLEHVSTPARGALATVSFVPRAVPRPVPAVAGYVRTLPQGDPIAGMIVRSELGASPAASAGATLTPSAAAQTGQALSPASVDTSAPARRPTAQKKVGQPRWSQDLPGFRTVF